MANMKRLFVTAAAIGGFMALTTNARAIEQYGSDVPTRSSVSESYKYGGATGSAAGGEMGSSVDYGSDVPTRSSVSEANKYGGAIGSAAGGEMGSAAGGAMGTVDYGSDVPTRSSVSEANKYGGAMGSEWSEMDRGSGAGGTVDPATGIERPGNGQ